jgi:hypothetical protein
MGDDKHINRGKFNEGPFKKENRNVTGAGAI